jgi:hypothetical protein
VVIGGQLFSKSLRGLTTYKVEFLGIEGLGVFLGMLILPLVILWLLIKLLPPWQDAEPPSSPAPGAMPTPAPQPHEI